MKTRRSHQSGVTLVEVLVSVLILGLAMISLAGLQSYTVKYQLGTANRAALSMLVSDFAERVRSNVQAAPGFNPGIVVSNYLISTPWVDQAGAPTLASTDCQAKSCDNPGDLAAWDMAVWRQRVREELPRGSVQVTGTIRQGMTVTLMWQDHDLATASDVCAANQTAVQNRQCCPALLPKGVRCANFVFIP